MERNQQQENLNLSQEPWLFIEQNCSEPTKRDEA